MECKVGRIVFCGRIWDDTTQRKKLPHHHYSARQFTPSHISALQLFSPCVRLYQPIMIAFEWWRDSPSWKVRRDGREFSCKLRRKEVSCLAVEAWGIILFFIIPLENGFKKFNEIQLSHHMTPSMKCRNPPLPYDTKEQNLIPEGKETKPEVRWNISHRHAQWV